MFSKLLFASDLPTWALFAEMAFAAVVVILAGSRFTKLAAVVADRLGLDAGWVGLILLATVTSLPELVTGGTATWIGNTDLALGNIFGSCSFNITLIVLMNAILGGGSVLRQVSPSHVLTSSFGLCLLGVALLGMVVLEKFGASPLASGIEISWVLVIFFGYFICMRFVYTYEPSPERTSSTSRVVRPVGRRIWMAIAVLALILVAASWWLARIGDVLSVHEIGLLGRPLGATFVGACFLALSTSLPEIVTSVSAVRLGNLDLALGNLFGSNMFNVFVVALLKPISMLRGDVLLIHSSAVHGMDNLIAGLLAIILTAVAIGGLTYKSKRKLLGRFGLDSLVIAVCYVGGMILLVTRG